MALEKLLRPLAGLHPIFASCEPRPSLTAAALQQRAQGETYVVSHRIVVRKEHRPAKLVDVRAHERQRAGQPLPAALQEFVLERREGIVRVAPLPVLDVAQFLSAQKVLVELSATAPLQELFDPELGCFAPTPRSP